MNSDRDLFCFVFFLTMKKRKLHSPSCQMLYQISIIHGFFREILHDMGTSEILQNILLSEVDVN